MDDLSKILIGNEKHLRKSLKAQDKNLSRAIGSIGGNGKSRKEKNFERQSVSSSQKKIILANQKQRCAECHKVFGASIHFHHKKFVSSGGRSTTDNLIALCPSCHSDIHIREKAKLADKKKKSPKKQSNPYGWGW